MDYSPEQFFTLVKAVEEQDGYLTDDLCHARDYELTGPKGKAPDGTHKPLILPGCGNVCIFEVPYVCEPQEGAAVVDRDTIQLCAVCDEMGAMPRFAGVMGA